MSTLRAPRLLQLGRSPSPSASPYDLPSEEQSLLAYGRSPSPSPSPQPSPAAEQPVPTAHLQVVNGTLGTTRPTPSPPFRLMPPSQAGNSRAPSPQPAPSAPGSSDYFNHKGVESWVEQSRRPHHMAATTEYQHLRQELRARPLNESTMGRLVISLLTYPWVTAPSGLAAMVFAPDVGDEHILDCARGINDLMCGATAYTHTSAGVLAVLQLGQLNKMLTRSGLSPIAPKPSHTAWGPLTARQPPDFLLAGWQPANTPSPGIGSDA